MNEYIGEFVQVNELKMHYYDIGKGYPIIMIHGGSGNALEWVKIFPLLSNSFRIIAPDCRGQGKTNNPNSHFSYSLMAQDIVELIKVLKLEKPIICGWSDGGQIGLELGINFPNKIHALILGGTFSEIFDDYVNKLKDIGVDAPGKVNFEKMNEKAPEFVEEIIRSTSVVHGKDYWKSLVENLTKMWLNPEEYPKDRVKEINLPVLIISGDKDQFVPLEETLKLNKMISGSNLAIAPNADHFLPITKPTLFKNLLIDFLQKHSHE